MKCDDKKVHAWVTKHALTAGIQEVDGTVSADMPEMLCVYTSSTYTEFFHGEGRDWHLTRESAVTRANLVLKRKVAAAKQKLAELEKMSFV